MLFLALSWLAPWTVLGPGAMTTPRQLDAAEVFSLEEPAWRDRSFATDPQDLAFVARSTLVYLDLHEGRDPAAGPGIFAELGVDLKRVKDTLQFVIEVAEQDRGQPVQRLQDPRFIQEHFELYRWTADLEAAAARSIALDPGQIRLTRYLVYQTQGRASPEGEYRYALYADPGPEHRGTTRQQAMAGVYEAGGALAGAARPLVYLTQQSVFDALMQGTIQVALPDGSMQLFNVAVSNDIPYDAAIKDPAKQARYWYFDAVDHIRGYGATPEHRTSLIPNAAVAGDIYNLGLGKIVAL